MKSSASAICSATFHRDLADRLIAEVPLGAFLSGGIDSTAVVTSMARALPAPPIVCSVGFQEKSHDELDLARATAARLHARHHTQVLDPDPRLRTVALRGQGLRITEHVVCLHRRRRLRVVEAFLALIADGGAGAARR